MKTCMTMASLMGALVMGLIPSLKGCEGDPVAFETYEKEQDAFCMRVDVPQGDGEREQNVKQAILQIIAETQVGNEVGKPIDGTLQQVTDDYQTKYGKYSERYMREEGTPYAPMGFIEVINTHQNELCATFRVGDGMFVNGGPGNYFKIVRFEDGHVMKQEEMTHFTLKALDELAEKYKTNKETPVSITSLEYGYWLLPLTEEVCLLTWEVSRYDFGEAKIPIAEIDEFLTDEGRKLLKAKPYELPARSDAQSEGDEEYDESYNTNIGLNGSIPEGTTMFVGDMSNFPIELTITKNGDGYRADYLNVRFKARMKLNGESLPADGGDVNFYGKDGQGNDWVFHLTGDANTTITGTAEGDNKQLNVTLRKKK